MSTLESGKKAERGKYGTSNKETVITLVRLVVYIFFPPDNKEVQVLYVDAFLNFSNFFFHSQYSQPIFVLTLQSTLRSLIMQNNPGQSQRGTMALAVPKLDYQTLELPIQDG